MSDPSVPPADKEVDLGRQRIGPPQPHIIETEVKGDLSLYDPGQEKVLVLNGTATDVWLLCDGDQTAHRIVELIAAAYGREAATIRIEVMSTIRQFIEEGFLPAP